MNERLIHLIATRQATERDLEGVRPEDVQAVKANANVVQFSVKSSPADVVNEEKRVLRYTWTDESVDADGDIIRLAGWDLSRFVANPVFLWGHDGKNAPPIGKAVSIEMQPGATTPRSMVDVEYAPKDAYQFADTIYQLAKRGFVNATSAGFRVLEASNLNPEQRKKLGLGTFGIEAVKQQLFEISNVSLPANENALRAELKLMVDQGALEDKTMRDFAKTFPLTEQDFKNRLREITKSFVDMGAARGKAVAPGTEIEPVYCISCEGYMVNGVFQEEMPEVQDAANGTTMTMNQLRVSSNDHNKALVEAVTKLVDASAKAAETNTRLVSAISDLTKRVALMGDNAGGAKAPEAVPSEAQKKVTEQKKPQADAADIAKLGDDIVSKLGTAFKKN